MPFFVRGRDAAPRRHHPPIAAKAALTIRNPQSAVRDPRSPVIAHVFPWQMTVGGAQAFVLDLCRYAIEGGAEVHLIHLGPGAPWDWADAPVGLHGHPVRSAVEAHSVIEGLKPDLIHQHYPSSRWGVKGLEGRYPIVGTPHNWPQNIAGDLPAWAARIAGPHARIRHGVDLELFSPRPSDGRGVGGEGPFRLGIAGRMHKDKFPDSFLTTLEAWKPQGVELVVAGRGLADDPIVERIAKRLRALPFVTLLGDSPRTKLPAFYRSLDALLVPTTSESVCLSAIEAMACGVPVIGRGGSGLGDTIGEGGWLCRDERAMLDLVDTLAIDPQLRLARRWGDAARKRADDLFDRRRMLRQYADLYAERTGGRVDLGPLNTCPASAPTKAARYQRTKTEDRKPVIAHILPWPFWSGGAERHIVTLANAQAEWADVHILFPEKNSNRHYAAVIDSRVSVHPCMKAQDVGRLLASISPDLFHHHNWVSNWGKDGIPDGAAVVATNHSWTYNQNASHPVVPICGSSADKIRHGIDLSLFHPRAGLDPMPFVVGYVGRFSAEKMSASFAASLAKFARDNPDVLFRIVGNADPSKVSQDIQTALRLIPRAQVGGVAPDQMPFVYPGFHALIVPGTMDSVSFAALEAMACGIPVIARSVEGLPDTVGDAGILAHDDDGLLSAIAALKDDRGLLERLGRIARLRAERLFDVRRMIAEYEGVYAQRSGGRVKRIVEAA